MENNKFCTIEVKKCSVLRAVVTAVVAVVVFSLLTPVLVEITKWWWDIVQGVFK